MDYLPTWRQWSKFVGLFAQLTYQIPVTFASLFFVLAGVLRMHLRTALWFVVVRSWQGHPRMGWKRPWSIFHIWTRHRRSIPKASRSRFNLQSSSGTLSFSFPPSFLSLPKTILMSWSGRGRRIWVFCEKAIGYVIFRSKLLWRVWQCWCYDECGWDFNVFVPGN